MTSVEQKLMNSHTLQQIHDLAKTLPININNKNDLKAALSACSIDLITALDGGRITFGSEFDRAALLGLLVVAIDVVLDGQLKNTSEKVTLH